jgi:pimeloyl-ACP methyl ester carboxylesterase
MPLQAFQALCRARAQLPRGGDRALIAALPRALPVLLLWGTRDRVIAADSARHIRAACAAHGLACDYVELDSAGSRPAPPGPGARELCTPPPEPLPRGRARLEKADLPPPPLQALCAR